MVYIFISIKHRITYIFFCFSSLLIRGASFFLCARLFTDRRIILFAPRAVAGLLHVHTVAGNTMRFYKVVVASSLCGEICMCAVWCSEWQRSFCGEVQFLKVQTETMSSARAETITHAVLPKPRVPFTGGRFGYAARSTLF